jgi:hypothetical protein
VVANWPLRLHSTLYCHHTIQPHNIHALKTCSHTSALLLQYSMSLTQAVRLSMSYPATVQAM